MEKEKIKKIRGILKNYELQLLILFGSYGEENFTKNSDIDLAVKVNLFKKLKENQLQILNQLSALFEHHPVDLVLLNHADPLIKFKVASEGKLLYQDDENLFENFQVKAAAEHNDALKFYQLDKKFIEDFLERSKNNDRPTHRAPKIK